jgi:hypothetical protein
MNCKLCEHRNDVENTPDAKVLEASHIVTLGDGQKVYACRDCAYAHALAEAIAYPDRE